MTVPSEPDTLQSDSSSENKRKSKAGCWLSLIVTIFLVITLIVVGLALPPFRLYKRILGNPYTQLDSINNAAFEEEFTFAISPDDIGEEFGVQLSHVSAGDFAVSNDAELTEARNAMTALQALQSNVYELETTGEAPASVVLDVKIPDTLDHSLLGLYGWNEDRGRWEFIHSQFTDESITATVEQIPDYVAVFQSAPEAPTILISYPPTQVLTPEIAQLATIVAPGGLQPKVTGELTGGLAAGFQTDAGYQVMPVLRNFANPEAIDTGTVNTILGNSALSNIHIEQIATLLGNSDGYDGVLIDYRGIPEAQRENLSRFIQQLGARLHQSDMRLGVVIPPAENIDGVWETGAYDWREISKYADFVQLNLPLNPMTYARDDNQYVEAMLTWAVNEMDRTKLLPSFSVQSVRELNGDFSPVGYEGAIAGLGDVVTERDVEFESEIVQPGTQLRAYLDGTDAQAGFEEAANSPYIDYLNPDGTVSTRVWLTTADALRFRLEYATAMAVGGIAVDGLLDTDLAENVTSVIQDYKSGISNPSASTTLALRWRIESADGLVDEIITGLNEDLVVTVAAPEGNYAINVAVISEGASEKESLRSGAEVALFYPTATPTPTPVPTATPTPIPTETPIPAPTTSGEVSHPSGGGQSSSQPGAGSIIANGFEYGGHVTSTTSGRAVSAMQQAGMTWMKIQARYHPGAGSGSVIEQVRAGQGQGFKVLVGTVGNPQELASGGSGYMDGYTNWLGDIAAGGADAIEVWNEPNLDREWPRDAISGAAYTQMLRQAYQTIKSRNGGTMVISGAPAPTGAEAAYPGQVVNDNNFLIDMVQNGALDFLDCVGAHYNEGIVPPGAMEGDPRDHYYTRYFFGMLNEYVSITGGQKPICFTELGYLTSEGYPGLPDFFSWASNVTVAQQAAWLAEAAALASQNGNVRLMIVWNVDFTVYGSDPQAGYAIVRPGGGCPACAALAGAR